MGKRSKRAKEVRRKLREAQALISIPSHWTKGKSARDGRSVGVNVKDPNAVAFCATGAVERVCDTKTPEGRLLREDCFKMLKECVKETSGLADDIPYYNDRPGRTHSDVMGLFSCAVNKAGDLPERVSPQWRAPIH